MAIEVTRCPAACRANSLVAAARWALLGLCIATLTTCRSKSKAEVEPSAPSAIPVASKSAIPAKAPAPIVTLAPEVFTPDNRHPTGVFAIEGALMVVEKNAVGRIKGDGVEWIGSVPKEIPGMGDNIIGSVEGRWPDMVGAVTFASNGRAPYPTFFPLTWKSPGYMVGPGGQSAWITSVSRIGDTLLLVAWSMEQGYHIIRVRGPKLKRKFQARYEVGCKKKEGPIFFTARFTPGVSPDVIGTTLAGTMISVGYRCEQKNKLTAEVWDNGETSRLIDLTPFAAKGDSLRKILKGKGDELFVFQGSWAPILRYRNKKFERVPDLGRPKRLAFTSPQGKLHATSGRTIHRFEDRGWVPVARITEAALAGETPKSPGLQAMVTDGDTFWGSNGTAVFRLRKVPPGAAGSGESRTPSDSKSESVCSTPFVYMYSVSYRTPKKYNFPKTQNALSTFPDVDAITLVVFNDFGRTRVGIKVTSSAQGKALIAHLKTTMKDEEPQLTCYDPSSARTIPIEAARSGRK